MKANPSSRKRFVFGGVLPFALLLFALPVAPRLIPDSLRTAALSFGNNSFSGPYSNAPCEADANVEGCNFMAAPEKSEIQEFHRKAALTVVNRWETEYRRKGALARVSAAELQRIRRALL